MSEDNPVAKQTHFKIQECIERAKAAMHNAQQHYKANAGLKTKPVSFRGGDRVLFSTKDFR